MLCRVLIKRLIIYKPIDGDRCGNSNLRCTPYPNPNLQMRGIILESGFRILEEKQF